MDNDIDMPAAPRVLFIDGRPVEEGTFVRLKGDDAEAGEVYGVTSGGKVLVAWPYKVPQRGWQYEEVWHDLTELEITD